MDEIKIPITFSTTEPDTIVDIMMILSWLQTCGEEKINSKFEIEVMGKKSGVVKFEFDNSELAHTFNEAKKLMKEYWDEKGKVQKIQVK